MSIANKLRHWSKPDKFGKREGRADDFAEAAAKIESAAKVIAALMGELANVVEMLKESRSCFVSGSRPDMEWDQDKGRIIEAAEIILATHEQTVGEKT